jgi:hypothetical protein
MIYKLLFAKKNKKKIYIRAREITRSDTKKVVFAILDQAVIPKISDVAFLNYTAFKKPSSIYFYVILYVIFI